MDNKRIYYLDVLRALACLLVIIVHISCLYVDNIFNSVNFWVGNVFDSFARVSVPIFVMFSGALMLDKDYFFNFKKNRKHILKLLYFFIFWSLVYFIINVAYDYFIRKELILNFFSIFKGPGHFWYIFLIIGLYLVLPILRLWINEKNKKYINYYIIISVIFVFIIPQIINIGSFYFNFFNKLKYFIDNLNLGFFNGYVTYFIIGWYLRNYSLKNKKTIYILGLISFLYTIFMTYVLSIKNGSFIQVYDFISINILLQSVAFFVLIKNIFYKKIPNKVLLFLSNNSFGVYAIHELFILIISNYLFSKINLALVFIPVVFIVVTIISFLTIYIFKKIKPLRFFV